MKKFGGCFIWEERLLTIKAGVPKIPCTKRHNENACLMYSTSFHQFQEWFTIEDSALFEIDRPKIKYNETFNYHGRPKWLIMIFTLSQWLSCKRFGYILSKIYNLSLTIFALVSPLMHWMFLSLETIIFNSLIFWI